VSGPHSAPTTGAPSEREGRGHFADENAGGGGVVGRRDVGWELQDVFRSLVDGGTTGTSAIEAVAAEAVRRVVLTSLPPVVMFLCSTCGSSHAPVSSALWPASVHGGRTLQLSNSDAWRRSS
jgi:hypothetical protein